MAHPHSCRSRMVLEPLEERSVPAVSLTNGVLRITGTPGPDQITITPYSDDPGYSNREAGFIVSGASRSSVGFTNSQVRHVIVDLGEGNDTLTVHEVVRSIRFAFFAEPMSVFGRGGNDVLEGGFGNDLLDGGPGADKLFGKGGNDALRCGAGDDEADGGTGDDGLAGEVGADRLKGGAGNDRMFGGAGADALEGGDGNDTLYGGFGADALAGGEGGDVFLLQAGDTASDAGADDARIHFADGRRRWAEAEVVALEAGVNTLLRGAGGAAALRRPGGGEYTFLRHGIRAGGEVVGNNLEGTVLFIDRLFTNPRLPAGNFLVRELGRD